VAPYRNGCRTGKHHRFRSWVSAPASPPASQAAAGESRRRCRRRAARRRAEGFGDGDWASGGCVRRIHLLRYRNNLPAPTRRSRASCARVSPPSSAQRLQSNQSCFCTDNDSSDTDHAAKPFRRSSCLAEPIADCVAQVGPPAAVAQNLHSAPLRPGPTTLANVSHPAPIRNLHSSSPLHTAREGLQRRLTPSLPSVLAVPNSSRRLTLALLRPWRP